MLKIQTSLAIVMAVLTTGRCYFVYPAGKCKNITGIPVNFDGLVSAADWTLVYVPDGPPFNGFNTVYRQVAAPVSNTCDVFDLVLMTDYTVQSYAFHLIYNPTEDTITEIAVGTLQQFRFIPLGVTQEGARLYYRCSDDAPELDYDTRFICIPRVSTLSAASEEYLLSVDASYTEFVADIKSVRPAPE